MAFFKHVAGVGDVELSPEEEAAWIAENEANTNAPVPLPDLEPWQFRAMLKLSGKEDELLAFLDTLPEPNKIVAKAKLEYTLTFKRNNDLVAAAQQALGLTDEQLDTLWTQAAAL